MTKAGNHRREAGEIAEERIAPAPDAAPITAAAAAHGAAQIAAETASIWRDIDVVLTPILGQRGSAGLFKRSIQLASAHHPWLGSTAEAIGISIDTTELCAQLAQRDQAEAAAAATELLRVFHDLLATLVGASLTDQLLRPVRAFSSSGPPAVDTSP
jgi:hypothetical protein